MLTVRVPEFPKLRELGIVRDDAIRGRGREILRH